VAGDLLDQIGVEILGLPLLDADGILRALTKTVPDTIAKGLVNHLGLSIDDLDGALGARRYTESATVALVLIYPDDLANTLHGVFTLP
jgi:hypothetical protein